MASILSVFLSFYLLFIIHHSTSAAPPPKTPHDNSAAPAPKYEKGTSAAKTPKIQGGTSDEKPPKTPQGTPTAKLPKNQEGTSAAQPPQTQLGASAAQPPQTQQGASAAQPPKNQEGTSTAQPPQTQQGTSAAQPPQTQQGASAAQPPKTQQGASAAQPPKTQPGTSPAATPQIQQACKATSNQEFCTSTLLAAKEMPPNPEPMQIIQTAILVSQAGLKTSWSKLEALLQTSANNFNLSAQVRLAFDSLRHSEHRIHSTSIALARGKIKSARAWMGAGTSNQNGCMSGLKKFLNASAMVNETIQALNTSTGLANNVCGMIRSYDMFGNKMESWDAPKTERDGVWDRLTDPRTGLWTLQFPKGLQPNVTVCKTGCDCVTVQQAVDRAPLNTMTIEEAVDMAPMDRGKQFVILIKEGVYPETIRVTFEMKNVIFLGEGIGKTVITGNLNVNTPGIPTTRKTATLTVTGDGFMATNLTIENTSNIDVQAVALLTEGDRTFIENCAILGHQDTLYPNQLRQYFKNCRIEGTVDFIFGNGIVFFQDCTILVRPRIKDPEKGEESAVTAQSRTDPSQVSGFVFQNCLINGTDQYVELFRKNPTVHKYYLGRPWRELSRTVYISCVLDLISPEGWTNWEGDEGLQTLFYGEFNSTGPGANPAARVKWSNQITPNLLPTYNLQNFIQAKV